MKRSTKLAPVAKKDRKAIMERLFRDNEELFAARHKFTEEVEKMDWVREYFGQYGSEALVYDDKGNLFIYDGSARRGVTLAESVEWSAEFESAGRLGIESDDNCPNIIRWMKQTATQLRACES